jgi:hypothetical protein
VVDLGDLLRVPGPAIEEMLHAGLPKSATPGQRNARPPTNRAARTSVDGELARPGSPVSERSDPANGREAEGHPAPRRSRRRHPIADNQLPLFGAPPAPSPDSRERPAS